MKPKHYRVLLHAVEQGITTGLLRFYKHAEHRPTDADIAILADALTDAAVSELMEWFDVPTADDNE